MYYAEGAYVHEIKDRHEHTPWRSFWQLGIPGCTYATHNLGPVLQWMRTRVTSVTCMGAGHHLTDARGQRFGNEDTTTMLCKLANGGMTIQRQDLLSDRPSVLPYYNLSLQGTLGCYEAPKSNEDRHRIWIKNRDTDADKWRSLWDYEREFLPESFRNPPAAAVAAGHDGSDYYVLRDFVDCILNDRKSPIDVYESLDMTLPGLVSQESMRRGNAPLPVPDFRTIQRFPDDLPPQLRDSWIMRIQAPTSA
jgi:hypothetical protein